jgi:small subunit ribosomal protein S16
VLKIRLQRVGRRNDPVFRLVAVDSRHGPKSGKFLEVLGSYDARGDRKPQFKTDRIKHWLGHGAQTSDTVHNLLISESIIEGKKLNVLPKKSPIKKEAEKEEKSEAKPEAEGDTSSEKKPVAEAPASEEVKEEPKEETPKAESDQEVKATEGEKAEEPKAEEDPVQEEQPKEEHKEEAKENNPQA